MTHKPPITIFAFNRPKKLQKVLDALKGQSVDLIYIFVDGPRFPQDHSQVDTCRRIAKAVNWVETELFFWDENHGLNRLLENIDWIMERHQQAVFLEDDCLPMPGFYEFMRKALDHYQNHQQVFSIGAYQAIEKTHFQHNPFKVVSSARFTCWGWGTWADRWLSIQPSLKDFPKLFNELENIPVIAGMDLPEMAKLEAGLGKGQSWAVQVAISTLDQKKVHLLSTRGLVRNIGQDLSGIHKGITSSLNNKLWHNRNLEKNLPDDLVWLEDTNLDCKYASKQCEFVLKTREITPSRMLKRVRTLFNRYIWPKKERYSDINLMGSELSPVSKRALFSYIVHPFSITPDEPRFYRHINIWHAHEIVRTLNRMGYLVDIIDYRDLDFSLNQKYDIFIGHGGVNYSHIAQQLPSEIPKIYFSTGSYWKYHNEQENFRLMDLQRRKGSSLPPDRSILESEDAALELADGIVGIGNQTTRKSYKDFPNVRMINVTALPDDSFDWCPKDYDSGRKHFLFFSGGGNIHKGLDLLLEAFSGLDQHLWIATRLDKGFSELYAQELHTLPNIHTLGWIQPRSGQFYQVMKTCNFCILPSASEGQSHAVIECMNQGLIPLVTPQTGLNVDGFGRIIKETSLDHIRSLVKEVSEYSPLLCKNFSFKARKVAQTDFSPARFKSDFQKILEEFLS